MAYKFELVVLKLLLNEQESQQLNGWTNHQLTYGEIQAAD
jgi:hypothetical protein